MVTHLIWLLIVVGVYLVASSGEVSACEGEAQRRAPSATMQAWGNHEISALIALEELTRVYGGDEVSAQQYFDLFEVTPFASAPVYPRWGGGVSGFIAKKTPPGQSKEKDKDKDKKK